MKSGLKALSLAMIVAAVRHWHKLACPPRRASRGVQDVMRGDPCTVRKYIRRAKRYRDHAGAGFL